MIEITVLVFALLLTACTEAMDSSFTNVMLAVKLFLKFVLIFRLLYSSVIMKPLLFFLNHPGNYIKSPFRFKKLTALVEVALETQGSLRDQI